LAARRPKLEKVQVYFLGIGDKINHQEVEDIASSKDKVFFASSFAELTSVAHTIVQSICAGRLSSPTLYEFIVVAAGTYSEIQKFHSS